jgi:hypothetical protein
VPAAGIRPLRSRDAEREHQPAVACEVLDPAIRRPRNGKIDVNPVGRGFGPVSAVVADDAHVRAAGKEALSPRGQRGVELDRRDLAGRADQLGRDRAIIARAGADMDDALAGLRAEGLDELGAQRRAGC